jgi:hypothetical protein
VECRSTTPPAEIACLVSDFSDEFEETGLSLPSDLRDNWSGNPDSIHHSTLELVDMTCDGQYNAGNLIRSY